MTFKAKPDPAPAVQRDATGKAQADELKGSPLAKRADRLGYKLPTSETDTVTATTLADPE